MEQPDLGELMSGAIALRQLGKRYGRKWAVRGLDLVVEPGQIYGLLGPNGAGKSTTIRMLVGLIRPTAGEVFVWGRKIGVNGVAEDGGVGALVEGPAFYEYFSGYRNLAMLAGLSKKVSGTELEWALHQVRLWGRHRDKVGSYSHGMRQRLAIAQALVPRPRLLVLDEPAQGLDPQGLTEVRELLKELVAQGTTVLLSSHLLHEVEQICTHVGIIAKGELIASGTVAELLASDEGYEVTVASAQAATAALAQMALVREFSQDAEDTFTVWLHEDEPQQLNAGLVDAGVGVKGLRKKRTELEDVYLQLAADEQPLLAAAGVGERGEAP